MEKKVYYKRVSQKPIKQADEKEDNPSPADKPGRGEKIK